MSFLFCKFNIEIIILRKGRYDIMGYESIHETVVADILETIKDGVHLVDGVVKPKSANVRMSSSLA